LCAEHGDDLRVVAVAEGADLHGVSIARGRGLRNIIFSFPQTPSGGSHFRASPLIGCVFSSWFSKQRASIGVRGTRVRKRKNYIAQTPPGVRCRAPARGAK
jgi:hypothetical protein